MINRTYVVKVPTARQGPPPPSLDICVNWPTGSAAAPVCDPATYPLAFTTPPAGWVAANGTGAYYEIRGRTIPLERLAAVGAAGGFTPRCNLGYLLSIYPAMAYDVENAADPTITYNMPNVLLSASLRAALGGDANAPAAIPQVALADPAYGPVIRIYQADAAMYMVTYMVHFSIFERQDEDFSATGGP